VTTTSGESSGAVPDQDSQGRYVIPREPYFFFFDPSQAGVWSVPEGAKVRIEAVDGWVGRISSEEQVVEDFPENQTNACTGPISVEGAEPGDTLVVDISEVELLADEGVSAMMQGWGVLGDRLPAPRTHVFPIEDGQVVFSERHRLPAKPMVGTIGVAPGSERVSTLLPGLHGGNMDIQEVRAGAQVYLPVSRPGAGLGLGDAKAIMGDGEIAAAGVEVPVAVLAQLRTIKNLHLPSPMIRTPER